MAAGPEFLRVLHSEFLLFVWCWSFRRGHGKRMSGCNRKANAACGYYAPLPCIAFVLGLHSLAHLGSLLLWLLPHVLAPRCMLPL